MTNIFAAVLSSAAAVKRVRKNLTPYERTTRAGVCRASCQAQSRGENLSPRQPIPRRSANLWPHPLLLLLVLAVAWLSPGCATVADGEDAKVVHAERVQEIAFATVNTFLRLERDHTDWTEVHAPRVHAVAETLRRQAPAVFRAAADAIRRYKRRQAPDTALEAAVGDMQRLSAQATLGLAELNPGGAR